jgi:hypothetical protein
LQRNAPGQYRSQRLRALDADPIVPQVEVGQRGADQIKTNRKEGLVSCIRWCWAHAILKLGAPGKYRREGFRAFNADLVAPKIQRFQPSAKQSDNGHPHKSRNRRQ